MAALHQRCAGFWIGVAVKADWRAVQRRAGLTRGPVLRHML